MHPDTEKFLTAVIAVGTNFSVLPLAVYCMRKGMVYESIIGACSAFTSIMYRILTPLVCLISIMIYNASSFDSLRCRRGLPTLILVSTLWNGCWTMAQIR